MKVLLIEDVDNLGYAGDVKKVANGFGRNYLIPQRLAVLATEGALKQAETIRKVAEKRRAQERQDAEAIANQISGVELLFERRAGETGKLYGSVTSGDIAEAIEEQTGIPIDKRKVALPEPLRSLGEQEVTIKLMIDLKTAIKVEVLPEGGILERSRLTEKELAEAEAAAAEGELPSIEEIPVEEIPVAEAAPEETPEVAEVEPETPAVATEPPAEVQEEDKPDTGTQPAG